MSAENSGTRVYCGLDLWWGIRTLILCAWYSSVSLSTSEGNWLKIEGLFVGNPPGVPPQVEKGGRDDQDPNACEDEAGDGETIHRYVFR